MSSDSDNKGSFSETLATNMIKKWLVDICFYIFYNERGWGERLNFFEVQKEGTKVWYANNFDTRDEGGLLKVGYWEINFLKTSSFSSFNDIDNTADRTKVAVEGEFADEKFAFNIGLEKLLREDKDRKSNWQIKVWAIFLQLGWREVNSDFVSWERKSGINEGTTDALFGFGNGFIGESNDEEIRESLVSVAFDFYEVAIITKGNGGVD